MSERELIFFDTETNGLTPRYSLLSICAIHVKAIPNPNRLDLVELGGFIRYYYPRERYSPDAIAVNGLTEDVITAKRADAAWPRYAAEDYRAMQDFFGRTEHFVAHNVGFDIRFVPPLNPNGRAKTFCTMREFTDFCALPHSHFGVKWPKLSEAAEIFGARLPGDAFHDAEYDTRMTMEIFRRAYGVAELRPGIQRFLSG